VRAFAAEVGLDPEATLTRLEHLLPGAPNPLPALNAKEGTTTKLSSGPLSHVSGRLSALLSTWAATPSTGLRTNAGTTYEFFEEVPGRIVAPSSVTSDVTAWLRLHAEPARDMLSALGTATLLDPRRPALLRIGATAIDALLLMVLDLVLVLLIALTSAIPVNALVRDAGWSVATFCAIPVAVYFLLFGGIGGSTVGRYACSVAAPNPRHPLTLPEILRRALVGR
jgi:hypothetical protein